MRNSIGKLVLFSLLSAGALPLAQAQDPSTPSAPPSFKQVFLYQLGETEKKLVSLAEAMPESKYSWRPAEGVRSVSELFMHEAGANVFFLTFVGVKPPAGFDPKGEKTVTEKAKVVEALKASFAHVRQGVSGLSEDDMMKAGKFMGGKTQTYQSILFFMSDHMHEHLGQAIAYARMNGVTPPWSKGKES